MELIKWDKIKNEIDLVKDWNEMSLILSQLEAIKIIARQKDGAYEVINKAEKYKIGLEIKAGEKYNKINSESEKYLKKGENLPPLPEVTTGKLQAQKELKKSRKSINQWVKLSNIENINQYLDEYEIECNDKKIEMTLSGLKKYIRIKKSQKRKNDYKNSLKEYKEIPEIKLINDDFKNIILEKESIDCILTDPPYPEKFLDLWQDLFIQAEKLLKPSGFLITYTGKEHLQKIFRMENKLNLYGIICLRLEQNKMLFAKNIYSCWRPILIFQKEPFRKIENAINDFLYFPGTRKKDLHEWQQSEESFNFLIESFTKINDLIYDPFAGSGTVPFCCKKLKRQCIAIEKNIESFKIIQGRLNE